MFITDFIAAAFRLCWALVLTKGEYMKLFFAITALLISTAAFAEVRKEISTLRTLSYNGEKLTAGYGVGGGCQEHRTDVVVELDEKSLQAKLRIFDVTAEPDFCEAFLYLDFEVELNKMIRDEAKKKGISANSFTVVLPQLEVSTY